MPSIEKVEGVSFTSGNTSVIGILYAAQPSPDAASALRPAAILLHGLPGAEKNHDIAYRLRDLGWHTLIVHFRGSWGSGGEYDLTTQPDDALAAVDYLLNSVPSVDPARIALVGYSVGSPAAFVAAHRNPRVGAVVSISGIADFDEVMLDPNTAAQSAPFLRGVTARSLSAQWMRLGANNPVAIVRQLTCPLLIVHGTEDEVMPYYMAGMLADAAGSRATQIAMEGADHTYTRHRAQLVESVTDWLHAWANR